MLARTDVLGQRTYSGTGVYRALACCVPGSVTHGCHRVRHGTAETDWMGLDVACQFREARHSRIQ